MNKPLVAFVFSLILVGCGINDKKENTGNTPVFTSEVIETIEEGGVCGGPERVKCKSGLECSDKNPTKTGICMALAEGAVQCSETRDPVCGLKNNNKNGYLNECEAKRHGAEVISKGFCKADKGVPNNCEASATSLGNCEAFFEGAFFDKKSNTCQEVGLSGCSADMPFPSIDKCKTACEDLK